MNKEEKVQKAIIALSEFNLDECFNQHIDKNLGVVLLPYSSFAERKVFLKTAKKILKYRNVNSEKFYASGKIVLIEIKNEINKGSGLLKLIISSTLSSFTNTVYMQINEIIYYSLYG